MALNQRYVIFHIFQKNLTHCLISWNK
jgi:hypothetical protein